MTDGGGEDMAGVDGDDGDGQGGLSPAMKLVLGGLVVTVIVVMAAAVVGTFVLGMGSQVQQNVQRPADLGYAAGGASDVNTFRENIENGYLPQPTDVTTEGLFNEYYFETGQRTRCRELFCPSYGAAVSEDPLSAETERYVAVGLNGNLDERTWQRPPLDIVVVLDTSGSMDSRFDEYHYDGDRRGAEASKIGVARDAVRTLARQLGPRDRLGFVTYDGDATVRRRLREAPAGADVGRLAAGLGAGGSTRLSAGLDAGYGLFDGGLGDGLLDGARDDGDRERRVVVITDAMPNRGDISTEALGGRLERRADRGVHTSFVGVGVDFNSALVERIGEVEGANYVSVGSAEAFRRRVGERFDRLVTPMVYDLEVRLDAPGYAIDRVYGAPDADGQTGRLLHVDTLFPSATEQGRTKGGIVLVKLRRLGGDRRVELTATWRGRDGDRGRSVRSFRFPEHAPEQFAHSGVRKAVALARYGDLLRSWTAYERGGLDDPARTAALSRDGLGDWEQRSRQLAVSPEYERRFQTFQRYLARERRALGDGGLDRELRVLERLSGRSVDGGKPADGRGAVIEE